MGDIVIGAVGIFIIYTLGFMGGLSYGNRK